MMADEAADLRTLVAEVAAAYFTNSHVNASDISNVISQIAQSLSAVGSGQAVSVVSDGAEQKTATPAQIRKSITPDGLISFEDGKSYKTLKRHLSTKGLTLDQYREKWGLPRDYPSVAPNYSAARSQMAKQLGLGQRMRSGRKRGGAGKASA